MVTGRGASASLSLDYHSVGPTSRDCHPCLPHLGFRQGGQPFSPFKDSNFPSMALRGRCLTQNPSLCSTHFGFCLQIHETCTRMVTSGGLFHLPHHCRQLFRASVSSENDSNFSGEHHLRDEILFRLPNDDTTSPFPGSPFVTLPCAFVVASPIKSDSTSHYSREPVLFTPLGLELVKQCQAVAD